MVSRTELLEPSGKEMPVVESTPVTLSMLPPPVVQSAELKICFENFAVSVVVGKR